LHIYFHLKTSDDLEVYEADWPSKDKLEEICDLRQPVMFNNDAIMKDVCNIATVSNTYGAFDVKVRNVKDTEDGNLYIPLSLANTLKATKADTEERFLSENNSDFLNETGLNKKYQIHDKLIRPYLVSHCFYDYILASKGTVTPFRYDLNYRNYYSVTEGSVTIKLAPPKSTKYLHTIKDYDNFEFRSPINPWQPQDKYQGDFGKIKCLELTLTPDKILFIPAFWWYSIKFNGNTPVCTFKYRTYMNTVAISPHLVRNLLQSQNIKHLTIKRFGASEEEKTEVTKDDD